MTKGPGSIAPDYIVTLVTAADSGQRQVIGRCSRATAEGIVDALGRAGMPAQTADVDRTIPARGLT